MPRYKLLIEYDGTNYAGWQKQQNGIAIQEQIEKAVYRLSGAESQVYASGRTDAGVHALGQVAHVDLPKLYPNETVIRALNYYLAEDRIVILDAELVDDEFHARFSAKSRSYKYLIYNRNRPLALMHNRAWFVHKQLNIENMQEAANYLIGRHDFTSFRTVQCQAKSPVITLNNIKIEQNVEEIAFYLNGRSFLHHMVRNIVGTLKEIGEGKRPVSDMQIILDAKDRSKAGITAPACGLYLDKIEY